MYGKYPRYPRITSRYHNSLIDASNAYLQYIEVRAEIPDDVDSHVNGHKTIGQNGFANGSAGENTPLLENGSVSEEGKRLSLIRKGRILGVLVSLL